MECLNGEARQGSDPLETEKSVLCVAQHGFTGAEERKNSGTSVLWPNNKLMNKETELSLDGTVVTHRDTE